MSLEQYIGTFLLCAAGDAMGFHSDKWEMVDSDTIRKELAELGGINKVINFYIFSSLKKNFF